MPIDNGNESHIKTEADYNFFYVVYRNGKNDIDSVTFFQLLTELSDKVQFGNNYSEVARCLRLPTELQQMAVEIDKQLAEIVC